MDEDLALPAGDYELWLEGGQASKGVYTVEVDREDPFPPAAALPAAVSVTLAVPNVAAYWDAGQHLDGTLTVSNNGAASEDLALDTLTSDLRWTVSLGQDHVTVAAGATVTVPLTVNIPSDAWADVPVRISVRGADGTGAQATGYANVTPTADAPPVSPYQAWSVPDALLGGLDVAATALGASPVLAYDPTMETELYDGYTPAGGGLDTTVTLPATFTTDLAGDAALPIAGMIVNPQARNADINDAPKDVELLLSDDGSTWTSALKGTMTPLGVDQPFVLPAPVSAKFARLQVDSTYGDGSRVAIGEFKVVAVPGTAPTRPGRLPGRTARCRRSGARRPRGDHRSPDGLRADRGDAARLEPQLCGRVRPGRHARHVDDRFLERSSGAAQRAGMAGPEWLRPDPPLYAGHRRNVHRQPARSMDRPGHLEAETRTAMDPSSPFSFAQPVWARYIRFTADAAKQDLFRELPGTLQAFEVPTDAKNRSILGEYGPTHAGPYEVVNPPALEAPDYAPDANDTADTATPLTEGQTASSTVHTGQDVDWYDVVAPAGQNTLTFTVQGTPRVGVSLSLVDDAGVSVPMTFGHAQDPGSATYTAPVTPGAHYRVEVQQPPFSVVFTFDTSGSMGNYLPFVYEAIHSFSDAVVPGRAGGEDPPVRAAVAAHQLDRRQVRAPGRPGGGHRRRIGSSDAETSLLNATDDLSTQRRRHGGRDGHRRGDRVVRSHRRALAGARQGPAARLLVHVGADDVIAPATALMQDWAYSSGGFYQYTRSHGEMDRAFDRDGDVARAADPVHAVVRQQLRPAAQAQQQARHAPGPRSDPAERHARPGACGVRAWRSR